MPEAYLTPTVQDPAKNRDLEPTGCRHISVARLVRGAPALIHTLVEALNGPVIPGQLHLDLA